MLSQSISEVPTTSKNGDAGKFFPKKLTSDQQKRLSKIMKKVNFRLYRLTHYFLFLEKKWSKE